MVSHISATLNGRPIPIVREGGMYILRYIHESGDMQIRVNEQVE